MSQPDPEYLTVDEIADELGVHSQTVQRYFRDGGLPGRKVGKGWRTTRTALNHWLTGQQPPMTTGAVPLETPRITLETKGPTP